MSDAKIGFCELDLYLPGITSLKQKRGIIKSMLAKMRNQFNVSAAEVGHLDSWQSSVIAVAVVSNSTQHLHQTIQKVMKWVESRYPDVYITAETTEIL